MAARSENECSIGSDIFESKSNKKSVDIQLEIDDIFKDIPKLCRLQKRVNILLLGKSGAGKSAFINTMYKAISGKYHRIAKTAKGNAQSITPSLIWYDHCGVVLELVDNKQRQKQLSECLEHFPTIIDFAGLGDEDTDGMRVILERLLEGCIEAGTDYSTLVELQTMAGVDCLNRDKLPGRAVTHVVFVQSWRDSVPFELLKCLENLMKRVDEYGARVYPIDVIVLLTRYDELVYPSADLTTQEKEKNKDDFQKCKQDISKFFRFEGSVSDYIVDWMNYSGDIKVEDKYSDNWKRSIDLTAIKLLRRFLEPGVPKQRPLRKLIDRRMKFKMKLNIMANTIRTIWLWVRIIGQWMFFAICLVVLSVFVGFLLSAKPK